MIRFALLLLLAGCAQPRTIPSADHHQHLFSDAAADMLSANIPGVTALDGAALIAILDSAGIEDAAVLSVAYLYGSPARSVEDEYGAVRAENDWVAAQAARYPHRLHAFCSFNPLKNYALAELERCATDSHRWKGIKLHFANSDVQLNEESHLASLTEVFRAANHHRMPIVAHVRPNAGLRRPYGAEQARVFLERLLPLVPDVPVQLAHLAGTGPGYADAAADSALAYLADAVAADDPRTRNLWFDIATVAGAALKPEQADRIAARVRRIGVDRILYGSDAAVGGNLLPRDSWAAFRQLPLTEREFRVIAANRAPYLRSGRR